MGIWKGEGDLVGSIKPERIANIEVVASAYDSVIGPKAYVSMPITTGRRFYKVLDRYHVRDPEALEFLWPGALWGEIIEPNLEAGKSLAENLAPEIDASLICPGVFDGHEQAWTQDEYLTLWLGIIISSVKEIYLCDGWEYSNGGAIEFARAIEVRHNFVEERDDEIRIFSEWRREITLVEGGQKLITAIKDLERRGHSTTTLRRALEKLVNIAAYFRDPWTSRAELRACRAEYGVEYSKLVNDASEI